MLKIRSANKLFHRQSSFTISLQDSITNVQRTCYFRLLLPLFNQKCVSVAYFDMSTITLDCCGILFAFSYLKSWTWRTNKNVDSLVRTRYRFRSVFLSDVFVFIASKWVLFAIGGDIETTVVRLLLFARTKMLDLEMKPLHIYVSICWMRLVSDESIKINQLQNGGMYSTQFLTWIAAHLNNTHTHFLIHFNVQQVTYL